MPIYIEDKKKCTGCGACYNICPTQSISMISDNCGFEYPKVENNSCTKCEQCVRVCPMISQRINNQGDKVSIYAAWSRHDDIRYTSTSGGIFSELAFEIINRGGAVVAAAYDDNNKIKHIAITDKAGIGLLRQSKYAQSSTGGIYSEVKKLLKSHEVLFCGSPCQVAGLLNYLGCGYNNLITVDFICRGVNSPKAYRAWINEIERKEKAIVKRVWFKYKEDGWKKSPRCTRIELDNGKTIIQKGVLNYFMMGYLDSNLYIRPSCSTCSFKGVDRISDITVGDFWGVKPSLDDDKGTSMVQINTPKGNELFHAISSNIECYKCDTNEVEKGNVMLKQSVMINPNSEKFLSELGHKKTFSKLVKQYSFSTIPQRVKHSIKLFLFRIHLFAP